MRMPTPRLTDRQREYLEHLRRWEASGQTLKAYAAEHDLELRVLYDFKKRLVGKGLWPSRRSTPRFVRAQLIDGEPAVGCRVHLPNGAVVELACPPHAEAWRELLETVHALS